LAAAPSPAAAQSADALYAQRDVPGRASAAADSWARALAADPRNTEAAWKLARARYWLGTHTADHDESRRDFEDGITAGHAAVGLAPNRPEGHFWLAANMGGLAESFGLRQGLKYRKAIKQELEAVMQIDPAFEQGSADRALGRWYYKVPSLFGGSHKTAEAHLRASLKYNPHSTASHYFLAEMFADDGRKSEAITELRAVMDAPLDPDWGPEDKDYKAKAQALLKRLEGT
jgi:tetratricopeptide (TPR) repeat protein